MRPRDRFATIRAFPGNEGRNPAGVRFEADAPPVKFSAGNWIV